MRSIAEEISRWKEQLPKKTCLVVVSKEQPLEKITAAYEAGHRHFGENRAQALALRYKALSKDIHWHMIGPLQRNKVQLVAPFVHLIQSVDSLRLLQQIEKEGRKQNRLLRCLLQVHLAEEEPHKQGLRTEELSDILKTSTLDGLAYVQISGLMGMASHSRDKAKVQQEFFSLHQQFIKFRRSIDHPRVQMDVLSMGMSSDYEEALSAGSNMLRIGAAILGDRPKKAAEKPASPTQEKDT